MPGTFMLPVYFLNDLCRGQDISVSPFPPILVFEALPIRVFFFFFFIPLILATFRKKWLNDLAL